MLDTPHYNGGTTTTDGLWADVPVVTLPKKSMGSRYICRNYIIINSDTRMGVSLLHALGLDELVADNIQHYEDIAVRLGLDDDYRHEVRNKLIAHKTFYPLFDTQLWVRNWERALSLMWDVKAAGYNAQHIILSH